MSKCIKCGTELEQIKGKKKFAVQMTETLSSKKIIESCGKSLGYRHLSGVTAYCGDDIGSDIIYCKKCKNREFKKEAGEQLQ